MFDGTFGDFFRIFLPSGSHVLSAEEMAYLGGDCFSGCQPFESVSGLKKTVGLVVWVGGIMVPPSSQIIVPFIRGS